MVKSLTQKGANQGAPSYLGPFITVTILFGIFGFLTNLNSNLLPSSGHLRSESRLVEHGDDIMVSCLLDLLSALGKGDRVGGIQAHDGHLAVCDGDWGAAFIPAANMVSFKLFLTASFVLATGVCMLQTSANPYVSILGPEHSAPARLTLAQAFNSLGTAVAPLVVGAYILTDQTKLTSKAAVAHTVQGPYIAIACGLAVLGIVIMFMHLPAITETRDFRPEGATAGRSIWSYKHGARRWWAFSFMWVWRSRWPRTRFGSLNRRE